VASLTVQIGFIPSIRGLEPSVVAFAWLNWLVCIEMLIVSLAHHAIFPVSEIRLLSGDNMEPDVNAWGAIKTTVAVGDIHADIANMARARGTKGYGTFGGEARRKSLRRVHSIDVSQALSAVQEARAAQDSEGRRRLARARWRWAISKVIQRLGGRDTSEALRVTEEKAAKRRAAHRQ